MRSFSRAMLGALLLALATACGGANLNQRSPGNPEGGVSVASGEIAVHPGGGYFVIHTDEGLMIGNLDDGTLLQVPGITGAYRLAFWPAEAGSGFFVLSREVATENEPPAETLHSYNTATKTLVWSHRLARADERLDVAEAAGRIILSSSDEVVLVRLDDGEVMATINLANGFGDLDLAADGLSVILTELTVWSGENQTVASTRVSVRSLDDGAEQCNVQVPNCSSELVLSRSGNRAFLAPTTCRRDPVSVVDFSDGQCTFRENLPGFGPVALAGSSGQEAVAFLDRDAQDPAAPQMPEEVRTSSVRYHLAFIDVETLAIETVPIGNKLPRYGVTPDGASLIVDFHATDDQLVRILDVATRTITDVSGPAVELNAYVVQPDSTGAWLLDEGLYQLDIPAATVSSVALSFVPRTLNITADGARLLLRDGVKSKVYVYDFENEEIVDTLEPPPDDTGSI